MYVQVYMCICIHLLSNTVTYQEKTSWLLVKWTMAEEQSRWTCNLCQYTLIQKTVSSCCFSPQISPLQTCHNTHAPQRIVHNAPQRIITMPWPSLWCWRLPALQLKETSCPFLSWSIFSLWPVLPIFQWNPDTLQQQSSWNLSTRSLGCICRLVALFSLCKCNLAAKTNCQPPHGELEYLSAALALS